MKKHILIVIYLGNTEENNFPVKVYEVPSEGYGVMKGAEIRDSFCKVVTCTQKELQEELNIAEKHFLNRDLSYFEEHYF